MSAQPVDTEVGSSPPGPELAALPPTVEVRRNAAVTMVLGTAAAGVAIAYLWRAAATGAWLDWALCLGLALVAVTFLRGLFDSRTPLLVVDEMGVRLRLGPQWRGLPWEAIDRVVVSPRRHVWTDGRVVVHLHHLHRAIEGLQGRGARQARTNQRLYGGALAVPLGLTTRLVGARPGELAERLADLGQGRADVVALVPAARADQEAPEEHDAAAVALDATLVEEHGQPGAVDATVTEEDGEPDGATSWWQRLLGGRREQSTEADHDEDDHDDGGGDLPPRPAAGSDPAAVDTPWWFADDTTAAGEVTAPPGAADAERDDEGLEEPVEELVRVMGDDSALRSATVRPIARLASPVAPLVIDDFEPEPAYDPVIGPELAAARTRVGLSVDELADRTRIRPHVIESIEVDDFSPCGGDFYARGHIRTLARVLGKDPVPLLELFEQRYATAPVSARTVFEAELATGMTGSMRRTTGGPNWTLLVAVVLAVVLVWSVVRLFAGSDQELVENPPPMLNGSAGLGNVDGEAREAQPPALVPFTVTAVDADSAVTVTDASGDVVFEGELVLGEVQRLQAAPPLTVRAENGAAVVVAIAGRERGLVGQTAQEATRTFRAEGG